MLDRKTAFYNLLEAPWVFTLPNNNWSFLATSSIYNESYRHSLLALLPSFALFLALPKSTVWRGLPETSRFIQIPYILLLIALQNLWQPFLPGIFCSPCTSPDSPLMTTCLTLYCFSHFSSHPFVPLNSDFQGVQQCLRLFQEVEAPRVNVIGASQQVPLVQSFIYTSIFGVAGSLLGIEWIPWSICFVQC